MAPKGVPKGAELVKTVIATTSAQQMLTTAEQLSSAGEVWRGNEEQCSDEAFEATIIRLDGTAVELLLRQAGIVV